jgi:hypothetical protein
MTPHTTADNNNRDPLWNDGFDALYAEARAKGYVFHCSYQDLWFTPDELSECQSNGFFRWGVVNWKLKELPASKSTYRGQNRYTLYGEDRRKRDRRAK